MVVANLTSTNSVPAVITDSWASRVVLVDSSLTGGISANAAIDFKGGTVFVRNVATSGYGKALRNGTAANSDLATGLISEWTSSAIQRLFPEHTPAQSLNLARASVPAEFNTNDFSQWANVEDYYVSSDGANWSPAFQRAIDSGRQIVYFPPRAAGYSLGETVIVRGSVRKITGLRSAYVTRLSGYTTAAIQFNTPSHGNEVTMERFRGWPGAITINTTNKVVLRDMESPTSEGYVTNADGVAANVIIDGMTGFVDFSSGTTATLRSMNPEYVGAANACVFNSGATIALLGAKSEGGGRQIYVEGGGQTEALGYYVSPFSTPANSDRALFNLNSSLFMVGFQRPNTPNYPTWVEEQQSGVTRTGNQTTFLQFYRGQAPTPSPTPALTASTVITGVSIIDSSNPLEPNRNVQNVINGSGLQVANPTSIRLANNAHDQSVSTQFLTQTNGESYIQVDLGAVHSVSAIRVWNYNESDGTRGMRDVTIAYSASSPYQAGAGTQQGPQPGITVKPTFAQATAPNYGELLDYSSAPLVGRYFTFSATSGFGSQPYQGLAEVRFEGVPAGNPTPTPTPAPTPTPTPTPTATPLPELRAPLVSGSTTKITTRRSLVIKGTARDLPPLAKVYIRVGTSAFRLAQGGKSWSAKVAVKPGRNTVDVRVMAPDGRKSPNTRVIVRRQRTP